MVETSSDSDSIVNTDTRDNGIKALHALIQNAASSGDSSISGEAFEMPSYPGLFVDNFGYIPLPLVESVAESLLKICNQAPYGHNYETKINKEVRDVQWGHVYF